MPTCPITSHCDHPAIMELKEQTLSKKLFRRPSPHELLWLNLCFHFNFQSLRKCPGMAGDGSQAALQRQSLGASGTKWAQSSAHTPGLFYLQVEVSQVLSLEISWCKTPGILTGKGEEQENLPAGFALLGKCRGCHPGRFTHSREQNSHGAARTSHDLFTLTLNTFPWHWNLFWQQRRCVWDKSIPLAVPQIQTPVARWICLLGWHLPAQLHRSCSIQSWSVLGWFPNQS